MLYFTKNYKNPKNSSTIVRGVEVLPVKNVPQGLKEFEL